ncbi:MAG: type II secretion system minor pseudopilin GspI [Spirochaetes bacterium]|nr:type II secretion system minor pseudopilin GspI [Spirochaetota bacterium]
MKISNNGFTLIEILVAIAILSIAMLGIMSAVSSGIFGITKNKNLTIAMLIAQSQMNKFLIDNQRGPDLQDEPVPDYPGFSFSRTITRYENAMIGPIDAYKVIITVKWLERQQERSYSISYIYPKR